MKPSIFSGCEQRIMQAIVRGRTRTARRQRPRSCRPCRRLIRCRCGAQVMRRVAPRPLRPYSGNGQPRTPVVSGSRATRYSGGYRAPTWLAANLVRPDGTGVGDGKSWPATATTTYEARVRATNSRRNRGMVVARRALTNTEDAEELPPPTPTANAPDIPSGLRVALRATPTGFG